MPKVKDIEISEDDLKKLILDDPSCIEEGLRVLGDEIPTDSGPLDILAADSDGTLTVIELKNEIDEGQLDQGLRYYDFVSSNILGYSRAFRGKFDEKGEPRLMLIAPSFSKNMTRIAKYIDVPLELKEYRAIQLPTGDKDLLFKDIEITPLERFEIPTKEEHLKNIEDESVRELCSHCIKQLEDMGVKIQPIRGAWFSIWLKGKRFMYLGCKKKFFVAEIQKPDGTWTERIRIFHKADWDKTFNEYIKGIIEA